MSQILLSSVDVNDDPRKLEILRATWRLIAERGYHEVRVADIARACGTSSGTVHYHFPGKQDVLVAALRHCVEQAFERQSAELRQLTDAREQLLKLIDLQLPRAGRRPRRVERVDAVLGRGGGAP